MKKLHHTSHSERAKKTMLAISTRHAKLMRTFSMKIDGENHTRSQRSNLPDFRGFIPFRDESESDEFCTRIN